jgi:hypothetical protein
MKKENRIKNIKVNFHFITKRGKDGSIPFFSFIFSIHRIIINHIKEERENKLYKQTQNKQF